MCCTTSKDETSRLVPTPVAATPLLPTAPPHGLSHRQRAVLSR